MIPLRIDFRFRTPLVVPSWDKPFDGPLARAAVDEATFRGDPDPIANQYNIGVARHTAGDQWCFMASNIAIVWAQASEPMTLHRIKRQRIEDYVAATDRGLLRKMPGFNAGSGPTKAGSYIHSLRWVERATAYVVASDEDRVRELVAWITHLGKLAHLDYGAISEAVVNRDDAALEQWSRRPLPFASERATAHVPTTTALQPPYWKRSMEHQRTGMVPVPTA